MAFHVDRQSLKLRIFENLIFKINDIYKYFANLKII